ncbi:MAG TPA: hypothetical protein VD866_26950 [Urbifossiella sp.]|nr:hypothetical protein [Urbifossiella sp.]
MRQSRWLVGAVAVVVGYVGTSAARQEPEYDLRGPAPQKGQVTIHNRTIQIKNAKVAIKAGGMVIDAKRTFKSVVEYELELLDVKDRLATKAQFRVVVDKTDTVTNVGGNEMEESKNGDLLGEVIVSERNAAGKWMRTLVGARPNDEQKQALDELSGPESNDDAYPAGKVKVGHKWEAKAADFQHMFGLSISERKGKLSMRLVRVERFNGEECAVIETKGKVTGIEKTDEGDMNVEMELDGLTWQSLKTGIDVKDHAKGRIRMSGTIDQDGQRLDLDLTGPITIEGTTRLKLKMK